MIDLLGQVFDRLTIVWRAENTREGNTRWLCRCICGKDKVIRGKDLRNGKTRSCGCLLKESQRNNGLKMGPIAGKINNYKHGHGSSRDTTYQAWTAMKNRCLRPESYAYKWYGAKGIKVCDRWVNSFEKFLEDLGPRPKGLTLGRIDHTLGYEPSNCRWETWEQQRASR